MVMMFLEISDRDYIKNNRTFLLILLKIIFKNILLKHLKIIILI